jgi:hypothetical protein
MPHSSLRTVPRRLSRPDVEPLARFGPLLPRSTSYPWQGGLSLGMAGSGIESHGPLFQYRSVPGWRACSRSRAFHAGQGGLPRAAFSNRSAESVETFLRSSIESSIALTGDGQLSNLSEVQSEGAVQPIRNHLVAFSICLILAVVFTLPASISPRYGLLGYPGDNFQHAWFLWHFAKAAAKLQNPFYTDLIFYPNKVNLFWSTTDPLAAILALPLNLTVGPVLSYNFSLIFELALAAFFGRLLCLQVCRNQLAALMGGICFGFSPFILAHALGHLSLVTAFPIPLYVIALDRLLRKQSPSWRDGVILGAALFLTTLGHYNYTVFCLLLTPAILTVDLVFDGMALLKRAWLSLSCAAVTFLVIFFPFLIVLLEKGADRPRARPLEHIERYSADVIGFLIPSWNHVLLGHFAQSLDARLFVAGFEGTVYVGPVVFLLACVGFWKGRLAEPRWVVRATLAAGIFYLLSLGPRLRLFGRQLAIPAPASVLYHFPFVRFVSAPARFHVVTALGLAILSSIGVAYLLRKLRNRWQRSCLIAAVGVMLLLDLLTVPFPRSSIVDPAWSQDSSGIARACRLPANIQKGTVLTFPLIDSPYSMKSMWMQMSDDGRYALIDGYVSYGPDDLWGEQHRIPILRSLLSLQGKFDTSIDPSADRRTLPAAVEELNLRAIVVFDSPRRDAAVGYIEAVLGRHGQSAGSCTVFEIAQNPMAASPGN